MEEEDEDLSSEGRDSLPVPEQVQPKPIGLLTGIKSQGTGSLRSSKQSLEYKQDPLAGGRYSKTRLSGGETGNHIEIFDEDDYDQKSSKSSGQPLKRDYHSEAMPSNSSSKSGMARRSRIIEEANQENQSQTIKTLLSSSSSQSSIGPSKRTSNVSGHSYIRQ